MLITLSGLPGSGTTTAAKLVCQELGLEHVTAGMIFRSLAQERKMTLEQFGKYAEAHPEVDWELDRRMVRRAKAGQALVEGRLAAWMMRREEIPALRVWLTAPEEIRAQRVGKRESVPTEEALRANRVREQSEWSRYMDIYEIDLKDMGVYDLVIDSHANDPNAIQGQMVAAARAKFPGG